MLPTTKRLDHKDISLVKVSLHVFGWPFDETFKRWTLKHFLQNIVMLENFKRFLESKKKIGHSLLEI